MQENKISRKTMLPASGAASIAWAPAQNWAELPDPVLPAPPYRILFVGANNVDSSQLSLKKMNDAFMHNLGSHLWDDKIQFQHSCFPSTIDLSKGLRDHDPIILYFAWP